MKTKKYIGLLLLAGVLYSCDSHTYEDISETTIVEGKVTYDANIKSVIDNNCISCHSENGSVPYRPLTTYAEVKEAVQTTNLLERIQKQIGEPQQMPQGGRMPQDRINLILQWNTDGLLEN
jgi:uncharacterized membrane protein